MKCEDCGFCGVYVNIGAGWQWYEMTSGLRSAVITGSDYSPTGLSPGPGHWQYIACQKQLQEWPTEKLQTQTDLATRLMRVRDCIGFERKREGVDPLGHLLIGQAGAGLRVARRGNYIAIGGLVVGILVLIVATLTLIRTFGREGSSATARPKGPRPPAQVRG